MRRESLNNFLLCPICGSSRRKKLLNKWVPKGGDKYYQNDIKYKIYFCPNCRGEFSYPMKSSDYDLILEDTSVCEKDYDCLLKAALRRNFYYSFFLTFLSLLIRKGTLLDVGTGLGLWLNLTRKIGYESFGIDVSEKLFPLVHKYIPKEQIAKVKEDDEWPKSWPRTFDIVTVFDVLEHVENPAGFLDYVSKRVHPEGLLLLSLPSRERYHYRSRGYIDDFISDGPPYHLTRYRKGTVKTLLKNVRCENFHIFTGGLLWRKNIFVNKKKSRMFSGLNGMLYSISNLLPSAVIRCIETLGTHFLVFAAKQQGMNFPPLIRETINKVYRKDIPFFEETEIE